MAKRRTRRSPGQASGSKPSAPGGAAGASRRDRGRPPERSRPVAARGQDARRQAARRPAGASGLDPWRIGILAVVLVGIAVIVGAVITSGGSASNYGCGQLLAPGGSATDGQATANQGRQHVATGARLDYLFCPPASGVHYSEAGVAPVRAGFYGPDSDIGPGSWVHNLEHGYVVALYRCGDAGCPSDADLAALRRFVNDAPQTQAAANCGVRAKALAARFDDMSTPYALLSWDRVLLLETFDADAALDFARRWMEVGAPEANNC